MSALLFAEVCIQADLPPGTVNIITGPGEIGMALATHRIRVHALAVGGIPGRSLAAAMPGRDVADTVARQIDRVADYLRMSDGRTIARDLESLARRQPALVFAGAFALGVVAARFFKSSTPGYRSDFEEDAGYARVYPGGEPAGLGGYTGFDREAGGFDARA